jgi:hypothetical protein
MKAYRGLPKGGEVFHLVDIGWTVETSYLEE